MDAARAIEDLTEISPQIARSVVAAADGAPCWRRPGRGRGPAAGADGARAPARRGRGAAAGASSPARGRDGRRERVRRPRRRAADRRHDDAGADRRPRLLRPEERACAPRSRSRSHGRSPGARSRRPHPRRKAMPRRKVLTGFLLAAGSLAGRCSSAAAPLAPGRAGRPLLRRRLDGVAARRARRKRTRLLPLAHELLAGAPVNRPRRWPALRDAAYLEGDFVLRSGRRSRYYLDKYRFETRARPAAPAREPSSRRPCASTSRKRSGSPGPSSAPSRSPPPRRSESGLPFLIVRKDEPRTTGRRNGSRASSSRASCVCLVEDVVTSGGAALEAVEALREAGLVSRTRSAWSTGRRAGSTASRRHAVRLRALFRAAELARLGKSPQNRMVERKRTPLLAVCARFCTRNPRSRRRRDEAGVRPEGRAEERSFRARRRQGRRRVHGADHRDAQGR